jgi:hypothetical protein
MIKVDQTHETTFRVTVETGTVTIHEVNLSPADYEKLTGRRVSPETLIKWSFEFLLERESNRSILHKFDLPVIGRYFPEYESTMQRQAEAMAATGT